MTSDHSVPSNDISRYHEPRSHDGELDSDGHGRACPHSPLGHSG